MVHSIKQQKQSSSHARQKGQVLFIVVLVMVVALTVGLSLALRSLVSIRLAVEEDSSQRAFSAAEAGVERLLKSITPILTPVPLNSTAGSPQIQKASINLLSSPLFLVRNGIAIPSNDAADIWLVPHNSADDTLSLGSLWTGTITVYWGTNTDPCASPALEVIVISQPAAIWQSQRYLYDGCSGRTLGTLHAASVPVSNPFPSVTFGQQTTAVINITNGALMKVVPYYIASPIGIGASTFLPSQGKQIDSTGVAGATVRKITFYKGYPEIPAEFSQYILFSIHP